MPERVRGVSLARALGAVSPAVRDAALDAHEALNEVGVPHLLVGGLAVGAHGAPYATQDVDFLVGEEAFVRTARGLVSFAPGVPIQVHGVQVDYLTADPRVGQAALLEGARGREELAVVPLEHLVYMKLSAARLRDQAAIVALLQAGADADTVRAFLGAHAPDLAERFERLVARAEAEGG